MPIKQLTPYLNFNGTAREAIKLYQAALGATLKADPAPWEKDPSRVMHAELELGAGTVMLSDAMPETPRPPRATRTSRSTTPTWPR